MACHGHGCTHSHGAQTDEDVGGFTMEQLRAARLAGLVPITHADYMAQKDELKFHLDPSGHCRSQSNNFNMTTAKVPWIPRRDEFRGVNDTPFYQIFRKTISDKYKFKSIFHMTYARAFTFYLPGRYHKMDALKMQKRSKQSSDYFINAGHFLSQSTDCGILPFYNLKNGEEYYDQGKAGIEFCKTPSEFLLEPWVLIQLPFQPALLHQWAAGVLTETLRYSKKLVEISSRGYAHQFHDLYTKLAELSQTLTRNCNWLLSNFYIFYCEDLTENIQTKAKKMYPEYPDLLAETLAALEFILSDGCTEILNIIKKRSWTTSKSPKDLKFSADPVEIGIFNMKLFPRVTVFNDLYWFEDLEEPKLYLDLPSTETSRVKLNEAKAASYTSNHCAEIFGHPKRVIQEIQNTLKVVLALKGMTNEDKFIGDLKKNFNSKEWETLKRQFTVYWTFKGVDSDADGFHLGGMIYQLVSRQADIFVAHSIGNMSRLVWEAARKSNKEVHFDTGNATTPQEFSVEGLMEKLQSVENQKESWTIEAILQKAKSTCQEGSREEAGLKTGEAAAKQFRNRARRLVLKMYETHYATLQDGPFKFHPECLFAQYVLPCLIALYVDADNDAKLDTKTKNDYRRFVHQLIKSYEEDEFVQVLEPRRKQHFNNSKTYTRGSYTKIRPIMMWMKAIFKNSPTLQNIYSAFGHIGEFTGDVFPKSHPHMELLTPTESEIQISMLCSRIKSTLLKHDWPQIDLLQVHFNLEMLRGLNLHKSGDSEVDKILQHRLIVISKDRNCYEEEVKDEKNADKTVKKDAEALTTPQLLGISIFEAWSLKWDPEEFFTKYQGPLYPLDPGNAVVSALLLKDWMGLQELFAPLILTARCKDLSVVSLEFAQKHLSYRPLLRSLTMDGKVPMEKPGQATFFPVQHCRWCGLVYECEFKLCAECRDDLKYPDKNFFCSEKCEADALENHHREDHAQFLMRKMGIGDE